MKNDKIRALLEEVRELEQSNENSLKKDKWDGLPDTSRDQWRGLPKMDGSWSNGAVPITVDLQNTFWAKKLNFSLKDYYLKPEIFVENYLRIIIERFKLFNDDTFIVKRIPIWMTSGYEGSMFGLDVKFFDDEDPWLDYKKLVSNREDLQRMKMPDFKTSGLMPDAIRMYETIKEIVDDDFEVCFPEWLRSVFGVAVYIGSYEDILVDMKVDPEFVHELFSFITESRKKWYSDLAAYLGEPVKKGNLYNDEVNCPSLSPQLYKDQILPFEKDLCAFHGGLHYWHSCGDTTDLLKDISKIPDIDMIHIGPWTSVDVAGKVFGDSAPLEICLNPQKDILEAGEEEVGQKIKGILETCRSNQVKGLSLRANGINIFNSLQYTEKKAREWCNTAKKIIG